MQARLCSEWPGTPPSHECEPDQAHCPSSALLVNVGEFPKNDRRGTDLDETVKPEPSECHGVCLDSRRRKDEDAHYIPCERGGLQQASSPQWQPLLSFGGRTGHQVSVSGPAESGRVRRRGQGPDPQHRLGDRYLARCWGTCLLHQTLLFDDRAVNCDRHRARHIDGYRVLASWANADQLGAPQAERCPAQPRPSFGSPGVRRGSDDGTWC